MRMYRVSTEMMYAMYLKGYVDGIHQKREPFNGPEDLLEWIRNYDDTTSSFKEKE
jgi:hypothetical protein